MTDLGTVVVSDDDVCRWLSAPVAVRAARSAVADAYSGAVTAPPRLRAHLGTVDMVFTVGGYAAGPLGFRAYGTWPGVSDQAVLLWDGAGHLSAVIVGEELGRRRTGALGGVAVDLLARPGPQLAAVIGSGAQAWAQLWACTAVRELTSVRVFSPAPRHRAAFAARARRELGVSAEDVASAEDAVRGADLILVATTATRPVLDASWIRPGAHVNTVGPKTASAHELPPAVADLADVVASDSPAQAAAYGERFFTTRPLAHLGAIATGEARGRVSAGDRTLYCSTGLAGSEIVIASAMLRAAEAARGGGTNPA